MRARAISPLSLILVSLLSALPTSGCGDDDDERSSPGEHAGAGGSSAAGAGGAGREGGAAGSAATHNGEGGSGDAAAGNESGGSDAGAAGGDRGGSSSAEGGSAGQSSGTDGCARLDVDTLATGTWDRRFTIAGVTGHDGITPSVYDFAFEPGGGVLAAGRFAYHEGESVPPLLRLRDGAWRPALERWTLPPPADGFSAIAAAPDGVLALATGDAFAERDGEIWLDEAGQQRVLASFSGQVRSLTWFDGTLYVAGAFQLSESDGGIANLALWDGEKWSAPLGGAADGPVLELLVSDGSLYVGGAFAQVGGVTSANVAAFDGAQWSPLPLGDALAVYALARTDNGELYAGGALGELGAASGVVQRVGEEWRVVGGGLAQSQTRGVVSDLVAHDGVLDVAGCFNSAGGLAGSDGIIDAVGLARWDGTSWHSLNEGSATISPWFSPGVCGDESVSALWDMEYQRLAYADGELFAGGSFAGIDGVQTQSLAVRRADEWLSQGSPGLGLGGSLDRVAAGGPNCELFGLGVFTHLAGKASAGRVARFSGDGWQPFDDDLPTDAYCAALDVNRSGDLAVGCMVFAEDGPARGVLLRPNANNQLVRLELDADLPPIQSVKWGDDGVLWLAGGDTTGFLARLSDDQFTVVSDDFDGPVQFIDVHGEELLVAGLFTSAGGVAARHIARYAKGTWSALGAGLLGQPQAIATDGETVYASTFNDGSGAYLLGAFAGESWHELAGTAAGLTVEDFYSFNQILPVRGGLVLVGTAELRDGSGRGALLFEDGKLKPVGGGGVHGITVSGVAVGRDSLWVGGVIAETSTGTELSSSVGVARLTW